MAADSSSPALTRVEPTLPSHYYFDPAHYRRELEVFWFRHWLYACRSEALARPRDFQVLEVGDQSLLLTRARDGALRAFHNTCRHRGSLLCADSRGRLPGDSIVCPYHGWTYALDGRLLGARHQLPSADFRREHYGLHAVAVDEWAGSVFVNLLGESAAPLREGLGSVPEELAHWPLAELRVGHRAEREVACNWKVFWENFSECFHCPGVHPELCELVPIYGRGLQSPADDPAYVAPPGPPARALAAGAVTWSLDGQPVGAAFPALDEAERAAGQTFGVLRPGAFLVAHVDYARIVRVLPRGPERTLLTAEWLFPAETLASPDFERERATALAARVVEQDAAICELHQRGLRSRRFETGVLVPQEYGVRDFQSWIRRGLGERT
jgi:Rieske 2Fe-2S family protein